MQEQNFLTLPEAAGLLGLDPKVIKKAIREGLLEAVEPLPSSVLIRRSALEAFRCAIDTNQDGTVSLSEAAAFLRASIGAVKRAIKAGLVRIKTVLRQGEDQKTAFEPRVERSEIDRLLAQPVKPKNEGGRPRKHRNWRVKPQDAAEEVNA